MSTKNTPLLSQSKFHTLPNLGPQILHCFASHLTSRTPAHIVEGGGEGVKGTGFFSFLQHLIHRNLSGLTRRNNPK